MKFTFRGGVQVDGYKNTAKTKIDYGFIPSEVIIPMSQHIGEPCECLVRPGDYVLRGQMIGGVADKLGCPVHSSVSGTVTDVKDIAKESGEKVAHAVIANDRNYTLADTIRPTDRKITEFATEELVGIIRDAGIAGMGGAMFPTYEKIRSAIGKVDTLIINCVECEPFLTANHRLMLEHPSHIINGAKILLYTIGLKKGIIAIEDNKPDALKLMKSKLANDKILSVSGLVSKYPQGDERQLVYSLTKREIPFGKLPIDVRCVVFNAETTAAVFAAISGGMPLIDKILTVDGDCVQSPRNLCVPIGSKYSEIVEYCGGTDKLPSKIITGGPMTGRTVWNADTPVTKGTTGIIVLSDSFSKGSRSPTDSCIRCGQCGEACPMRILPMMISQYKKKNGVEKCREFGALSCVECGVCTYVCPAGIPVSQYVKEAKESLIAEDSVKVKPDTN